MAHKANTLGQILREARQWQGLGLRQLARSLNVSPSYITDIEANRRVPSEELLGELAAHLGLDEAHLMEQAGRLGEVAEEWLRTNPLGVRVVRLLAHADATDEQLQALIKELESR